MAERNTRLTQNLTNIVQDLPDHRIVLLERLADNFALDHRETAAGQFCDDGLFSLSDRLTDLAFDSPSAGERFEGSKKTRTGGGAVQVNDHMPELAAGPLGSQINLSIDNNPSTDTGAQKNADDIFDFFTDAQPFFGYGPKIHIIAERNLSMKDFFQSFGQRITSQMDIRRNKYFILRINNTRNADPNALEGMGTDFCLQQDSSDNIFDLAT